MFFLSIFQWNKSALETSFCFYGRFLAVYRVTERLRETSRPSSHPTNFGFSLNVTSRPFPVTWYGHEYNAINDFKPQHR